MDTGPEEANAKTMSEGFIHTASALIDYINDVGFLPLLNVGVAGWSADEAVDEECRYAMRPDGSWEWPLWEWKGEILRESGCAYGKFFGGKAAFVSRAWWPDMCNYRRSRAPLPAEDSIERAILDTLKAEGSMVSRELRAACGMTGRGMRSRFDSCITRLQAQCRIVTEDFVYAHDSRGHRYGWGLALLTTPEALFGVEACRPDRTPDESRERIIRQLRHILPALPEQRIARLAG